MPTAQSSTPPFGATTTLGGGTAGALTAESDPLVWYDLDNDVYFFRNVVKDDTGTITGVTITDLAGGVYFPSANTEPAGIQPTAELGPNMAVTPTRLVNATANIAAGALAVQWYVIADGVTLGGVSLPLGVGATSEQRGYTTPLLAFDATGGGTGDVFILEERAV